MNGMVRHRTADGLLASAGLDDLRLHPGPAALPLAHHGLDHEERHEQHQHETGDERRLQEHREPARCVRDAIDGIHAENRSSPCRQDEGGFVSFSWHLGTAGVTVPRGVLQSKAMAEPEAMLIAIVDDEERLCRTLAQAFQREGFRTCTFPDGLEAWKAFERGLPDLAVLDITMPRLDGLELCRRIRGVSERLPVIFLTSRDEEFDRVLGLSIGADDYLCKPFSLRELVARVRVLFRRAALAQHRMARRLEEILLERQARRLVACGDLRLDPPRLATTWQGVPVRLPVTEFRILAALARGPGGDPYPGAAACGSVPARRTAMSRPDRGHAHQAHPPQARGRGRRLRRHRGGLRPRLRLKAPRV